MIADHRRIRAGLIALALAGGLLLGACGGTDAGGHSGMDMDEDSGSTGTGVGEPGQASEASRTVKVGALDALEFDPASIDVEAGETVTFEVTNAGETDHEFSLGDADFHQEHEQEMAEDDSMMMDEDNAISLAPGETKEITWTFPENGEVTYACHVAGHFEAGMVGRISVN